jgi:inositol phosphorylceramide mannosyltransferase catalytic subunit
MENIPRIIHQTWKSESLSPEFQKNKSSWISRHPDWKYCFYEDSDCRRLVVAHYPELLPVYDSYSKHIQRIDMFRYLVVNRYGGLYVDMDMQCFKPIDTLLKDHSCIFSIEAHITSQRQAELNYARPYQIANCIFASVARHPFLNKIVTQLKDAGAAPVLKDDDIEDATGPRMLTRLYYQSENDVKESITLLPQINLMSPKEYPNIFPLNMNMYAMHHCAGTWKDHRLRPSLKRRWIERNKLPRLW